MSFFGAVSDESSRKSKSSSAKNSLVSSESFFAETSFKSSSLKNSDSPNSSEEASTFRTSSSFPSSVLKVSSSKNPSEEISSSSFSSNPSSFLSLLISLLPALFKMLFAERRGFLIFFSSERLSESSTLASSDSGTSRTVSSSPISSTLSSSSSTTSSEMISEFGSVESSSAESAGETDGVSKSAGARAGEEEIRRFPLPRISSRIFLSSSGFMLVVPEIPTFFRTPRAERISSQLWSRSSSTSFEYFKPRFPRLFLISLAKSSFLSEKSSGNFPLCARSTYSVMNAT